MGRTKGTISLAEMLRRGWLEPGERLVIRQRSAPDVEARLGGDGLITVGEKVYDNPSAAARDALGARAANGWQRWRVARLDHWRLDQVREANGHYQPRLPNEDVDMRLDRLGGQPFGAVLADPPWRFQNRTGKVAPEHRRLSRYDTMSVDDIASLPVASIMAEQSHCYLWVPNALVANGLRVMEGWGFTYKAMLIWHKVRKDGGSDGRGVGFYFRNVTEPVLFGVRGRLRTLAPGRRQVNYLASRKREHSRKPDELYGVIEACSPGPYVELFARHPRSGWQVWGDESAAGITPRGKLYPAYANGESGKEQ